jgi:hypothetical protein
MSYKRSKTKEREEECSDNLTKILKHLRDQQKSTDNIEDILHKCAELNHGSELSSILAQIPIAILPYTNTQSELNKFIKLLTMYVNEIYKKNISTNFIALQDPLIVQPLSMAIQNNMNQNNMNQNNMNQNNDL